MPPGEHTTSQTPAKKVVRGRTTYEDRRWTTRDAEIDTGWTLGRINHMKSTGRKSSISKAKTYAGIGDFWDEHDLPDYWGKPRSVRAEVDLESEESLYRIEKGLAESIR